MIESNHKAQSLGIQTTHYSQVYVTNYLLHFFFFFFFFPNKRRKEEKKKEILFFHISLHKLTSCFDLSDFVHFFVAFLSH
jgi:hypothetical protein